MRHFTRYTNHLSNLFYVSVVSTLVLLRAEIVSAAPIPLPMKYPGHFQSLFNAENYYVPLLPVPVITRYGPGLMHTLVMNADADPELEVFTSSMQELYAGFNHDGSPLFQAGTAGFCQGHAQQNYGFTYSTGGDFSPTLPGMEVFLTSTSYSISGQYSGASPMNYPAHASTLCSGIPASSLWGAPLYNVDRLPNATPSSADIDGDGRDEIVAPQNPWGITGGRLYVFNPVPAGTEAVIPGRPDVPGSAGHNLDTPALANVDLDPTLELFVAASPFAVGGTLQLYRYDFPITTASLPTWQTAYTNGYLVTQVVVGDLLGTKEPEVAFVRRNGVTPATSRAELVVLNAATGATLSSIVLPADLGNSASPIFTPSLNGTAPALADLNGDGKAEVLVQLYGRIAAVNVVTGQITSMNLGSNFPVSSGPVVGDFTGDGQPDIATVGATDWQAPWLQSGMIFAFQRNGSPIPIVAANAPAIPILGQGAIPAIADIDRDGRSELLVSTMRSNPAGMHPKVIVLDFGGATNRSCIEWGQFNGSERHNGWWRPVFKRGDANRDGLISIADATAIQNYLASGSPVYIPAADVNDDNLITAADTAYLTAYLNQTGPAPSLPFTNCGVDPTP